MVVAVSKKNVKNGLAILDKINFALPEKLKASKKQVIKTKSTSKNNAIKDKKLLKKSRK